MDIKNELDNIKGKLIILEELVKSNAQKNDEDNAEIKNNVRRICNTVAKMDNLISTSKSFK